MQKVYLGLPSPVNENSEFYCDENSERHAKIHWEIIAFGLAEWIFNPVVSEPTRW